jgi:hypothetical protein
MAGKPTLSSLSLDSRLAQSPNCTPQPFNAFLRLNARNEEQYGLRWHTWSIENMKKLVKLSYYEPMRVFNPEIRT